MDTKTFLETVLGNEGFYCVFASRLTDKRLVQKFYPDIDTAIHAAHDLDADGYDAYFALGTFTDGNSRKVPNVKQMRSFFLDLDCGPSKDYKDQPEALATLREFCKAVGMPRPTVVNSGRGIHVYWPLAEPVAREDWVPVAERFKRLCAERKMYSDPAVTSDCARVLRVPGTHNHKSDPPADVEIVGRMGDVVTLTQFKAIIGDNDDVFKRVPNYKPSSDDALMQALTSSVVNKFKTIMMRTINGTGCAQLADVVQNQGDVPEPMWRAGLSIAKFCVDGSKAIHRISCKHPEYSEEGTEEKASRIQGPYLCTRFDEYRPGICPDCAHWGKIKSPIVLGREVEEADPEDNVVYEKSLNIETAEPLAYTIPKYPHPYFRGKNGGVFKHTKDDSDEPKDKLVYFNDLYVVRRIKDPEAGESLVMRLHLPRDGVREFMLPLTSVGSKDEFRKHIAAQGVAVLNVTELMEYTMRWVNELQFTAEAEEARRQFGWTDESGTSFALGNMEVFADRIEVNSPSKATAQLFPIFAQKGTLEGWKKTMAFYNRPGMALHQFMVGISFGSVLMHFQPINAAAFHVFSKGSGLGKTTAMLAGASVWGNPDLLMMQERDTFNSKMNRAEVYKNIVCYMDEMTNSKPADLSDWAYQLPSGMQRNRMSSMGNVERVRGKPWKALFGTTGNTSMIERIALFKALPQAEAQRILEYRAQPVAFDTKHETDVFAADIKEHYGHAGIVFLQYLMNNLDACKELAVSVQQRIDVAAGLKAENRFWSVLASRTIAGLMIAKRAGLIDWEIAPIVNFIVQVMQEARTIVTEMSSDVETILSNYLAEHYNSILRIRSTEDARRGVPTIEQILTPEASPRGNAFVARYEYDIKKMFLLPKPLKEWCGKQQINYSGLIDGLRTGRTRADRAKMRLTKGTHFAMPPTDVIVIDCTDFLDDENEQHLATTAALFQKQDTPA